MNPLKPDCLYRFDFFFIASLLRSAFEEVEGGVEKKADVAMKGRMCGWVCGIDMVGWEVVQKEGGKLYEQDRNREGRR